MPYPVGSRYGRDIAFFPPVSADVEVEASLFVNSSTSEVKKLADELIGAKGVKHGKLTITTTGKDMDA